MARQRKRWKVIIENDASLGEKIRRVGSEVEGVLSQAVQLGADDVVGIANQLAPGPHVTREQSKPWNLTSKAMDIGPDKQHWFYSFFESGVQAFEIHMLKKRATRGSGKTRPIHSDKRAVRFSAGVFSVVKRGPMPARPFLRQALLSHQDAIAKRMGDAFVQVLDALLEAS